MFLRRWTGKVIDHPWLTLGGILILTIFFIYFIPQVRSETDFEKLLPANDPATQALHRAEKTFGSQDFFMVMIEAPDTIFKVPTIAKIHQMEEQFKALPGVDKVIGPTTADVISATAKTLTIEPAAQISPQTPQALETYRKKVMGDRDLRGYIFAPDGKAAGILLKVNPYLSDTNTLVAQVNRIVRSYRAQMPGLKLYVGGMPQIRASIVKSMQGDLQLLIPLVILVMEIVVFLAFRTLRGVSLPFLLMILGTIWTVGTMGLVGSPVTPFSFFMPVMLIMVSKAYGIYTVNRYYEEVMHHGRLSKKEIVLNTMAGMGRPLSMDALAEATGFLSLLAATFWPQQTFGLFIAVGIAYTFLLNFTLLPALLALLPLSRRKAHDYEHGWLANGLAGFGNLIGRRRGWVLGLSGAILIVFAVAIPSLRVETTPEEFLGKENPAMIASNALERHFGGSEQLALEIDTGKPNGLQDPVLLKKMVALQEYLKAQPEYGGSVSSVANLVRNMNQKFHADNPKYYVIPNNPNLAAQLLVLFTFSGGDLGQMANANFSKGEVLMRTKMLGTTQISGLLRRVNGYIAQHFPPTMKVEAVGSMRAFASMAAGTLPDTGRTILIALIAAFLIVALLLRSIVAALVAISPMVVTIVMNLGTMGYLGLPLDLSSLMIGSIAVGVGIDYTINFIVRWRAEVTRGHSLSRAHEITMRTMGRGILFNALTLTLGFAVFYLSNFQGLRNFGLLINLTMIWSFLGSFTLIPALLLTLKPRFLTTSQDVSPYAPAPATSKPQSTEEVNLP
ncbi:MAG TPA: RND family transporter [Candidatus Fraserbacteria bacterium]|nr:RND family transporter [Candidatus Fraserbacteria bacterium]